MTETSAFTDLVLDVVIPARSPWSHVMRRGQKMRLIDIEGQQAVDALFYSAADTSQRYSAQDTVREQGSAYIGLGTRLVSNQGVVMARVVEDSSGRHDTLAGCCSCESNVVRFGEATRYQHACRENFVLELGRYGMGKRDVAPNVNFFMNVPIDDAGNFAVLDGISPPGSYIDLVAEMDLLCVFSNCPQINNPSNDFNPTPVRVMIWDAAPQPAPGSQPGVKELDA
ncbi:MAG TPA: urea amidolyase associated protein UAAP2 [Paraburkholderia sp.]|jgi:urea carboxylase-associated protein 1|nr:urea amidolyase associated protein UAAP2 [Paraburkholderia sp.]